LHTWFGLARSVVLSGAPIIGLLRALLEAIAEFGCSLASAGHECGTAYTKYGLADCPELSSEGTASVRPIYVISLDDAIKNLADKANAEFAKVNNP
jgi:hypothetical protein